jgi:hypothetical protein
MGLFTIFHKQSTGFRLDAFPAFPNRINDSLGTKLPAHPRRSAVPLSPADPRENGKKSKEG